MQLLLCFKSNLVDYEIEWLFGCKNKKNVVKQVELVSWNWNQTWFNSNKQAQKIVFVGNLDCTNNQRKFCVLFIVAAIGFFARIPEKYVHTFLN